MGSGSWSTSSFVNYTSSRGLSYSTTNCSVSLDGLNVQDMFVNTHLDPMLNPKGVIRECRDSEEHPETIPIALCVDTTGSMGQAGMEVASKLNVIITELYKKYRDIQICVMGIGDLAYDSAPIQISQFESDIRIAEQLDKIYFERGGGGNGYESYSVAWYYGLRHMNLDCWKRSKKGIIITTGDEPMNPHLNRIQLNRVSGDSNEADIETKSLYKEVSKKFDIYHIAINDPSTCYRYYESRINDSFGKVLPEGHLKIATMDGLAKTIVECIDDALSGNNLFNSEEGISW